MTLVTAQRGQSALSPGAEPAPNLDENPEHGEGFFARGDGDCSLTRTASDVVTHIRGLGGDSACDNDDCDRDGTVAAADVECAARCLFGECPVPPGAPRVIGVAPESTPGIRPFSLVRITGASWEADAAAAAASIGGRFAEVVGASGPDELLVMVPNVEPGGADVIVYEGDVASARFPTIVEPVQPVGPPDSFRDLLALLGEAADGLLALDLDEIYGAGAGVVRRGLEAFRDDFPTRTSELLGDPGFTSELESQFDTWADASGLPEMLRDAIGAVEEGAPAGEAAAAAAGRAMTAAARLTFVVAESSAGTGGAASAIGATFGIGSATGAAGSVAFAFIGDFLTPDTPVISSLDRWRVEPGHDVVINGEGFGGLVEPNLVLAFQQSGATKVIDDAHEVSANRITFRIPDEVGVCGQAEIYLELPFIGMRSPGTARLSIKPRLDELLLEPVVAGEQLPKRVAGLAGCIESGSPNIESDSPNAVYVGREGHSPPREWVALTAVDSQPHVVESTVPRVVPGRYAIELFNTAAFSDKRDVTIDTALTGLAISCSSTELPVGGDEEATCRATGIPSQADAPFIGAFEYQWTSSVGGVVEFRDASHPERTTVFVIPKCPTGNEPTTLSVVLRRTDIDPPRFIAESTNGVEITVTEENAPTIELESDSPEIVEPGDSIHVIATARDDFEMGQIVLTAAGEGVPVLLRRQEFECPTLPFPCLGERDCNHTFTIQLLKTGFTPGPITVSATAVDGEGNEGASNELLFSVESTVPPTGGLAGRVLHQQDNSPIDAASLFVLDADANLLATTESSPDGSFAIDEVRTGSVRIVASKEGFRTGEKTVTVELNQTRSVTIHLEPGSGRIKTQSGTVWAVVPHWEGDHLLVEGAVVTLLDSERKIAGVALTDTSGEYELRGFWEYPVITIASKEPFATASLPFSHSTSLAVNFWLPWVNDECTSALNTFDLFGGAPMPGWGAGGGTDWRGFGETELGGKEWAQVIHPDGAAICLSGGGTQPTVNWNEAWVGPLAHRNCRSGAGRSRSGIIRLAVMEWLDGRWESRWALQIPTRETGVRELQPPIRYGESSGQGDVEVSGDAASLRSDGTFYRIDLSTVGGCTPDLVFRVK